MARKTIETQNVDTAVGKKIFALRLSRGWSRMQVALKIGITHQQLQKYEKGTNRISSGRLSIIAKVFGVSVGSFFDATEGDIEVINGRGCIELVREYNAIKEVGIQDSIRLLIRNIVRTQH